MRTLATITLATLAVGLAACGDSEPEPMPTATTPGEPVSILRPDVEQPEKPEEKLEPLQMRIGFPDGEGELGEAARADLATLLASPQYRAGGKIVLRGHTDSEGNDQANLDASEARAEVVRDWLVDNGAKAERFTIIPLGEQRPIAPNAHLDGSPDEQGRALNRRVDITIELPKKAERSQVPAGVLEDEAAEARDAATAAE